MRQVNPIKPPQFSSNGKKYRFISKGDDLNYEILIDGYIQIDEGDDFKPESAPIGFAPPPVQIIDIP